MPMVRAVSVVLTGAPSLSIRTPSQSKITRPSVFTRASKVDRSSGGNPHGKPPPGDPVAWPPGAGNRSQAARSMPPLAPGGPIGLGYLNVYGVEKALEAIAQSAADPCVFLVHPWELLDPAPGTIPKWMRTGCTSDTSNLDAFLARVRQEHDVTTLDAELAGIR